MSHTDLKALEAICLRRVQEQAEHIRVKSLAGRCGAVYDIARGCVPEDDTEVAQIFVNNLAELNLTDCDAREAMEDDDGIHLCRGLRYALTMYLFHLADGWLTKTRA